MIREDKFLISHAPYAVDLEGLRVTQGCLQKRVDGEWVDDPDRPLWRCTIQAAWFRRKNGVTTAHVGTLWDTQTINPLDAVAFLRAHDDGRYGGDCKARWDGDSLWAPESTWAETTDYEDFLRPMLEKYPAVPPGFDGWWTFKAGAQS